MSETSEFGSPLARESFDASRFYNQRMYAGVNQESKPAGPENDLPADLENKIIHGDSSDMSLLPDRCVDLMVTSPPYNVGKAYQDNLELVQYLDMLAKIFSEVSRVLVHGGRAAINVNEVGRKPCVPLHAHITDIMIRLGFLMRGTIIWSKGAGAGTSCAWGSWKSASNPVLRGTHEYILVFSKGQFKRRARGQSTIGRDEFLEWTKSVWEFAPTSARRVGHPAPFPVELPKRIIQLYSYQGDVVLDPFMGSGQTALAALQTDRRYIGYDISMDYCTLADQRIGAFYDIQNSK